MVYSVVGSLAIIGAVLFSGATTPSENFDGASNKSQIQNLSGSAINEVYEYKGRTVTTEDFLSLNSKGLALQTVYSYKNGLTVVTGFDSIEESDVYIAKLSEEKRNAHAEKKSSDLKTSASIAPMATVGGCPGISYGSRDYVDGGCGGNYLAFSPNDTVANFGTFGMNDLMSSYTIAPATTSQCLITKRYYNNSNYDTSAGTWTVIGEFNAYTSGNFSSVQNDKVSSEKSFCS